VLGLIERCRNGPILHDVHMNDDQIENHVEENAGFLPGLFKNRAQRKWLALSLLDRTFSLL